MRLAFSIVALAVASAACGAAGFGVLFGAGWCLMFLAAALGFAAFVLSRGAR